MVDDFAHDRCRPSECLKIWGPMRQLHYCRGLKQHHDCKSIYNPTRSFGHMTNCISIYIYIYSTSFNCGLSWLDNLKMNPDHGGQPCIPDSLISSLLSFPLFSSMIIAHDDWRLWVLGEGLPDRGPDERWKWIYILWRKPGSLNI